MPARSISRWDTISASLGVSRRMGKKYRESRMGSTLAFALGSRPTETGSSCKTQEHQRVQRISHARKRGPAGWTDHGALHDKPDDKLKLIKYELSTRN